MSIRPQRERLRGLVLFRTALSVVLFPARPSYTSTNLTNTVYGPRVFKMIYFCKYSSWKNRGNKNIQESIP